VPCALRVILIIFRWSCCFIKVCPLSARECERERERERGFSRSGAARFQGGLTRWRSAGALRPSQDKCHLAMASPCDGLSWDVGRSHECHRNTPPTTTRGHAPSPSIACCAQVCQSEDEWGRGRRFRSNALTRTMRTAHSAPRTRRIPDSPVPRSHTANLQPEASSPQRSSSTPLRTPTVTPRSQPRLRHRPHAITATARRHTGGSPTR
jgi:hypothetical protein